MFNRGRFNRLRFNVGAQNKTQLGYAELDGGGDLIARPIVHHLGRVELDGGGDLIAESITVIPVNLELDGGGDLIVNPVIAIRDQVEMDGGDLIVKPIVSYRGKAELDGGGDLEAIAKVKYAGKALLDGGGDLPFKPTMHYSGKAELDGGGDLIATPNAIGLESIFANITLEPGDILVIDTCRKRAWLNGVNVLEKTSGAWIKLLPKSLEAIVEYVGNTELEVKIDSVPRWI